MNRMKDLSGSKKNILILAIALLAIALCVCLLVVTKSKRDEDYGDTVLTGAAGSLLHEGYKLEQVVVLSRHNIRSPLSGGGSLLGSVTPYEWHEWSSAPSELSLKGGILETEMGQFFGEWMESEGLIPENWHPADAEVRIYANSKQRTIATAEYFTSGAFPTAGIDVEWHGEFNAMDPVFNPQLTFYGDDYAADAEAQIFELYGDSIKGLKDNYELMSDVISFEESEGYKNGDVSAFEVDDSVITLDEGAEPAVSGSLKTACSISDALVLQYYEETDDKAAGFGKELSEKEWESIAKIKDVYEDVLFSAPLVADNVANPLLEEMYSEMNADGRVFTFLCGHDSNLASVMAALGAEDYELPGSIEKKTPIGSKLVFSKWSNEKGEIFWSADLVYQSTQQLRNMTILSMNEQPMIYHVKFGGIRQNSDGLYTDEDIMKLFRDAIGQYQYLYREYVDKAA